MFKISKMTALDVPQIALLEQQCFSSPWSEQSLLYTANNESSAYFVAKDGKNVIGYGGVNVVIDEGYIGNIAVNKEYRHKGVGLSIVNALNDYAVEKNMALITLEVRVSNTPAISLYEKCGFTNVGVRKNFYIWPTEDAIIMTKWFGEKKV